MHKLALMHRGRSQSWRAIYWPAALLTGSAFIWGTGTGDPVSVPSVWAVWWPWLIIGWWLVFFLQFSFSRQRVRPRGADAAAMLAVVVVGTLLTSLVHLAPRADWTGVGFGEQLDLYDLLGENYEFREEYEWGVPAGAAVEIRNTYGSVRVIASPDDRVRLSVRKSVRASNVDEAGFLASQLAFDMEERDWGYVVSSKGGAPRNAARFRTSLDVAVPAGSPVAVANARGSVDVEGVQGSRTVYARDGGVRIRATGGSIDAHALRGDVRIVFERPPEGRIALTLDEGDLRVELPMDSGFRLSGSVWPGAFRTEFPGIVVTRDGELKTVAGLLGAPSSEIDFRVTGGTMSLVGHPRGFLDW